MTPYGGNPILRARGKTPKGAATMAVTYDQAMGPRRERLSESARRDARELGKAYALAVQVMELRQKHGLTQAELADRSGIAQADISRIERGVTAPNGVTFARLAEALDAEWLLVPHQAAS